MTRGTASKPATKPGSQISMTLLLFIGLSIFLLWAALFEINQSVRAQGQVIPSSHTQIIQAADGGVLSEILVREGQRVNAGQRVALLEKDRSSAGFEESRAKVAALSAALQRAQAEASGRALTFSKNLKPFPEFIAAQQALYLQRQRSLQEELATLNEALVMAQQELRMNEDLHKTGDTSQIEVMRAQRQLGEVKGKINAVRNKYLQDARAEASKLEEELSSSRYKLEERQSILDHTELTAPVTGIVKSLKFNTIGGVLRAGDELMQISPTDADMLLEIKINPVDIGQLKSGMPVTIKIDAFDYSIYGTLSGWLSQIGADTITEQGSNGQASTYYRAQVKIYTPAMLKKNNAVINPKLTTDLLKPGMTATVDIQTNRRTILQYLAKPVFKAFGGALNER